MREVFVQTIPAGVVIFREGAREACMYHVLKGSVGIYSRYGKANETCLTVIHASDATPYFGEMGLVDGKPRSATAVALEECELGEVRETNLKFYLQQYPELVLTMIRRMSGRLRALTEEYMDACHVIAQQEEAKHPAPEWETAVTKYTSLFNDPPTEAELAALAAAPRYQVPFDPTCLKNTSGSAVMEARFVPAGAVIFRQGDAADCMYDLMQGSVGIYTDYGLSTEKKLTTLSAQKSRFLGEMGMVDAAPRSATAVAETDCQMLTIDAQNMDSYFLSDPDALLAVIHQMGGRIRSMTDSYLEAVKNIAENERYMQNGGSRPEWLTKNLKFFADLWKGLRSASSARL